MNVALAQINPTAGDIDGNVEQIIDVIERARERETDIVAFPELAVSGYCISDLIENEVFVGENEKAIEGIATETDDIVAIVGFIQSEGEQHFNAAAVLQDGEVVGVARKALLPTYRYFDETRYFTPAERCGPVTVEVGGEAVQLGVSICEDMWHDEDPRYERNPIEELAESGADVLLNINASPFWPGKREVRHEAIRKHVEDTGLPFFYVNTVGAGDNGKNIIPFDGQSLAYNADGELLAIGEAFAEDFLIIESDVADARELPKTDRITETYRAIVMGLRDYADKTEFREAVVPVSGGIDSSLGLALTVDALGKENVTAYTLPSAVNTETTQTLAHTLAGNLSVELHEVPIQEPYEHLLELYEEHVETIERGVSKENVYARLRGLLMMLAANEKDALLITNGNETELALGYMTLYGDMSGGIAILGDVGKMDVYRLARHVNEQAGRTIIPEETFEMAPSAELAEGQEDPFDYEVVDPLVKLFVEGRKDPRDVVKLFEAEALPERFPDDVYERFGADAFATLARDIYARIQDATYKRAQAPPVIAVSRRAFGFDLRETIINKWRGD